MGILVWLDFQFASAVYPRNNDFVQNVVAEVVHLQRVTLTLYRRFEIKCGGFLIIQVGNHGDHHGLTLKVSGCGVETTRASLIPTGAHQQAI